MPDKMLPGVTAREERTERGQLRFFFNLGRTVKADILDRIFLGSQKTSQMAAYVPKSKTVDIFDYKDQIFEKNK